ncbi:MAG: hypothetical protein GX594_07460 [Pirellulaceae bacterium]|nr:hypothetical protein [Pirellulaceae bacterium]
MISIHRGPGSRQTPGPLFFSYPWFPSSAWEPTAPTLCVGGAGLDERGAGPNERGAFGQCVPMQSMGTRKHLAPGEYTGGAV